MKPRGLQVLSAHPTRLLYRCSVCVRSGDAWIMSHAVFNRVLAKDVHCSLGSLLSLALFTLQCCSSLFLRDQFMDSHHVRSVRYDFFVFLWEFYTKLLICTLGTDVNIKNSLLLQTRCVCVDFFSLHQAPKLISVCFKYSCRLKASKVKWMQIYRIFEQNVG